MPSSSAAGCPPASLGRLSEASTVDLVCCHAWPASSHSQGYDYRHLRRWLASLGIRHRLARKGIESSPRLGWHLALVSIASDPAAPCGPESQERAKTIREHSRAVANHCREIARLIIRRTGGGAAQSEQQVEAGTALAVPASP